MLKVLMLRKKIEDKKKELEAVRAAGNFETREAELEASIEEAETDEEKAAVDEEIEKLEAEKKEAEEKIGALEREVEELETELAGIEEGQKDQRKDGNVNMSEKFTRDSMEYRTAFRDYIQTGKLNKDILEFDQRADAVILACCFRRPSCRRSSKAWAKSMASCMIVYARPISRAA